MPAAVFMGTGSIETYHQVYNRDTRAKLLTEMALAEPLITRENMYKYKDLLSRVEYAFSSWGMPVLTEQEIQTYLPKLKAVFYAAGTVQYFAVPFLNSGVKVFSAWAANAVPVAEYAVSQIILANKGFFQAACKIKREGYDKAAEYCKGFCGNYSAKVGLLGAGMIGREVIRLLKPYRLKVMVFDPFLPQEKADELGVELVPLEEIFRSCDVISNHLANNEQTRGMLGKALFSQMKRNATFINTGRGAQVVEADLAEALKEMPDRTALLDVTDPEPPAEGHEFYKMDNVFLTPHIAGSMNQETQRMGEYMCQECLAFLHREETHYEVTREMLKTMA